MRKHSMMRSRKSMYFTVVTIAFLFIFTFVFLAQNYRQLGEKMGVVEMRVLSMNDFVKDIERDSERGLYISSYRALLALEEYIITNGTFLSDVENSFREAIFNGTVQNQSSYFMSESTLPLWIEKIEDEAANFNIGLEITPGNLTVYQKDPWHVRIGANFSFALNDTSAIASWQRDTYIEASLSLIGFEDPLYIIYSYGRISNNLNATPYENNFTYDSGGQIKVSNLLDHLNHSYYSANPAAPSFLMRLKNDLGPSPYGIESMVDLLKLSKQGLNIDEDSSIIDYYYWQGSSNGDYRVNQTPSWFKIDYAHLQKYNASSISCQIGSPGCNI
ncbi:MAG TPA: hypothetical protein VFF28_00550 [Candidatus Nanoarchaeia archaeon]|nr:hypothetical protein [Candidatus Nanoarchaeia archaeon]